MSVGQPLLYCKIFKFLTLLVALVGTIDPGVSSGGSRRVRTPLLKPEKYKKNL